MSLTSLAIFAILMWRYPRKSRDGEIFVLYLALYAAARFFIEFLRGDEDRGFVFHHLLSTSQFIAILALATAVWMAVILRHKPARQRAGSAEGSESRGRGNLGEKRVHDEAAPSARVKVAPMAHAPKRARD
jgi:prolipoprotein diacylglyceryltransferase